MAPFLKALEKNKIEADKFERFENWPIMEGYFTVPIIFHPRDWITIKLRCDSAVKIGLVLDGFILEPIGKTISWYSHGYSQ